MPAPHPPNEDARLAALRSYGVLDTPPEEFFDHVTALAAEICQTPIALVSLVDGERQWFKSRVGLAASETPRDVAFCAHAILAPDELLVVPDAWNDARFADNPLVLGDPNVRFYAGAPIVCDGQAVGTLCVIDREPRWLTPTQLHTLATLRASIVSHLELRRVARELRDALTDRAETAQMLAAQHAVLRVLVEARSSSGIGDGLAEAFGQALGLDAAGLWLVADGDPRLVCGGAWIADGAHAAFREATRAARFAAGEGLPGRVVASGQTAVITGLAADPNFPRAGAALASGLRTAFAIPIHGERGIIGALEVFSRSAAGPSPALISGVEHLGRQIGIALERAAAEEQVVASGAQLRAIIDSALDCIITIDADGRITDYNPAAEQTFGWRRAEVLGEVLGDRMVPAALRSAHAAGMQRHLATGDSKILGRRLEVPAMRADGTEFPVELTVLRQPGTGAPRFTAFLRDITERRQVQAAMAEAQRAAEAANRAKTEFIAIVSHEIRTPINAIIGMTELASEEAAASERRELMATVQSNAEHLLDIVNQILDVSKLEAGQMDLALAPCDLGEVAEDVVEALAGRASDRGIELTCDVDPALPTELMADAFRVRQILMNLVGNAIKFTATGAVDVMVVFEAGGVDGGDAVRLRVRDTGHGIAESALTRIFEAFYQVDSSTTRGVGGTGLGLSICRALTQLMGGRITAESQLGRGSTFEVVFPVAAPAPVAKMAGAAPRAVPGVNRYAGLPVLVVGPRGMRQTALVHALVRHGLVPTVPEPGGDSGVDSDVEAVADPGAVPEAVVAASSELGSRPGLILVDDALGAGRTAALIAAHAAGPAAAVPLVVCRPRVLEADAARLDRCVGRPLTRRRLGVMLRRVLGGPEDSQAGPPGTRASQVAQVLVVDDNLDSRRYVTRLLERGGHRVQVAADGRAALTLVQAQRYDLIIADIEMPEMDGFAFARATRASEAQRGDTPTPIVALSAHAVLGFREKCLAAGMQEHLAKPVRSTQLLDTVARLADCRPLVLFADDARDSRELVRRYLANQPYRLALAVDGQDAVRQFQRGRVALVVIDMNMPVMNGYDAVRVIRASPGGALVPIIASTGFEGAEEEARCRAAGCSAFVVKPVFKDALLTLIRTQLAEAQYPEVPVVTVDADLADLVPGYLAGRARDVLELRAHLGAQAFERVRGIGHDLKGTGLAYGFATITELGRELESAGRDGNVVAIARAIEQLALYLERVRWAAGPEGDASG